jgi:hypothetical protein
VGRSILYPIPKEEAHIRINWSERLAVEDTVVIIYFQDYRVAANNHDKGRRVLEVNFKMAVWQP